MNLLVCIPTIKGREDFVAQAIKGYHERTPEADVTVSFIEDRPTCGIGWQDAIDQGLRTAQQERSAWPDYIHFGNDDIVVAEGWLPPLVEAVEAGCVPAARMEPAGVHLDEDPAVSMAPAEPPPLSEHSYFYADLPENQPRTDWATVSHASLPFCSLRQWYEIGPFIPTHFGTDKWFFERARRQGIPAVARLDSVIFNYAAQIGRSKGEWNETDIIDFDLVFAYPQYESGELDPSEEHPLRLTDAGLNMVRGWRALNFPGPHHWQV